MAMAIDPETDLELRLRYPYGERPEPVTLHDAQTYAGDGTPVAHATTHEWSHGLGEIVQGALDAGLVVRGLAEHYYTEWQMLESMVKDGDDRWVLPEAPSGCRCCSRCRRPRSPGRQHRRRPASPCPEAASRRRRRGDDASSRRGKASWPFASPGSTPSRSSRCSTFPTKPSPPSARCASSPTIRACRAASAWPTPQLGEELLLLNHAHQPANTPYRSTHAIYVRRLADRAFDAVDTVPEVMTSRLVAVRAFDARHMMIDADVSEGEATGALIERLLANPEASYLQAHYARRGCYAARIERA